MRLLVEFVVPGAPVPCARPRVFRNRLADGRTVARVPVDPRTDEYEARVALCALVAWRKYRCRSTPGPFRVELDFYRARRAGDVDNLSKAALDGITRAKEIWFDDEVVEQLEVKRFEDKDKPRTVVRLFELG